MVFFQLSEALRSLWVTSTMRTSLLEFRLECRVSQYTGSSFFHFVPHKKLEAVEELIGPDSDLLMTSISIYRSLCSQTEFDPSL